MVVLVVDDEPDIVRLLEIALGNDFTVVSASTGQDALVVARRERPGVVLMDRRLPDGDGLQLLEEMRRDPITKGTPIILVTALTPSTPSDLPPGVVGFIEKPFDPIGLPTRIRAMLHGRNPW
jgi:two-component system phosphate regulon response regulator PhoB